MAADELDSILARGRLTALFQPIVACRAASVYGYEALIRGPSDSPLHSPLNLFDAAGRLGRLVELDLQCRRTAIAAFGRLGLPGRLFINVTPTAIAEANFRSGETVRFLKQAGIAPERVVIELTEQFPIHDYGIVRAAVDHYRAMGFSIAIDDLGAGYSSLRHWAELKPDYVKLDRHFVHGLDQDASKRQFLRSILDMSRTLGGQVVAEGIETLEEYRNLWSMGLELGQGYYFARPQVQPPRTIGNLLPASDMAGARLRDPVRALARPVPTVDPQRPVEEVAAVFEAHPGLRSLPVVGQAGFLGLIRRPELLGVLASRYGRALYSRKPATAVMQQAPIIVPEATPVEEVSQRIGAMAALAGDEDIVLVDVYNRYVGICTIMDLLRKLTDLQVRNARYANPLSGLPGNVPISEHIDELLVRGEPLTVVYCDLDQFKAFNDCYGYSRGDEVIVQLAQLLQEHVAPELDFLGHVGGDDFLMVFSSRDWQQRCQRILDSFGARAPWFYEPAHRAAGGIHSRDRQGQPRFYPIMSLSLAAVPVEPGDFTSRHEISAVLSEIKDQAKRIPGNSLFVDRRQRPRGPVPGEQAAERERRAVPRLVGS